MTNSVEIHSELPFIAIDAIVISDGGHLVMSQYFDMRPPDLRSPLAPIIKGCESKYAIEHSPTVRISSLERFRDYGEPMIEDDQEGHAYHRQDHHENREVDSDKNRELERALSTLGQNTQFSNKSTETNNSVEHLRFGREWWIFSTAISPPANEWVSWRNSISANYDHVSTIRQTGKFALALGMMMADQKGPRGKKSPMTHTLNDGRVFRTQHDAQLVAHGPVWYAEDVLSFLKSIQNDPLNPYYTMFVKDRKFEAQREYRFIVKSDVTVTERHIDLYVSGMMRDALAPFDIGNVSRFETIEVIEEASTESLDEQGRRGLASTSRKSTKTRGTTERWKVRHLDSDGTIVREESHTRQREVVFTEDTLDRMPPGTDVEQARVAIVQEFGKDHDEVVVDGITVEEEKWEGMRVIVVGRSESEAVQVGHAPDGEDLLVKQEESRQLFDAIQGSTGAVKISERVMAAASDEDDGRQVFGVLDGMGLKIFALPDEKKIAATSAAWHSTWAIWNLHTKFGPIVESIDIERGEFVGIQLKETEQLKAKGRILVGPHGTYAYVLKDSKMEEAGHGGRETGLVLFPSEDVVDDFEKFGWKLLESEEPSTE